MEMSAARGQGLRVFGIVWLGQMVSVIGSGLTSFALGVWVFQRTGSATQFALIGLCAVIPRVVLAPLAGVIVDRWDRRRLMILADAGAALSTLALAVLLARGRLALGYIYLVSAINAALTTIQWPAYAAATTLLVPERELGRANGMIQFGRAAGEILAPTLAGVLIPVIGLEGVIVIDCVTFGAAVATLALVRFPGHPRPDEPIQIRTLGQELAFGWRYIVARRGLKGLLALTAAVDFLWGGVGALITPMILGFANSKELGVILSVAGVGLLTGGLAMTAWGGPKRRILGVLGFEFLSGLCFILMGLRPAVWTTALGAFGAHLTIAVVFGCNQAIWQSKVAPEAQGRVFATQAALERSAAPLAYLLAGPLADRVFNPLLAAGPSAGGLGAVIGVGVGRGIGLMFLLMGVIKMGLTTAGALSPAIRRVEEES
jgi:MFS family permease